MPNSIKAGDVML